MKYEGFSEEETAVLRKAMEIVTWHAVQLRNKPMATTAEAAACVLYADKLAIASEGLRRVLGVPEAVFRSKGRRIGARVVAAVVPESVVEFIERRLRGSEDHVPDAVKNLWVELLPEPR